MGNPINQGLEGSRIDLSHQEMERLVRNLHEIWDCFATDGEGNATGVEWLPVDGIGMALVDDLGYEDIAEFEDALGGSFGDFLDKLPGIEKKLDNDRWFFKVLPEPPQSEWKPVRMTLQVLNRSDLWRVCLKSPYARIEIPELEFEVSVDGKRTIDSIYNHIGSAVFNLGQYVSSSRHAMSEHDAGKIMETVEALNVLLDVEKPWTWVVHDPSGLSEFKPSDGVVVEYL